MLTGHLRVADAHLPPNFREHFVPIRVELQCIRSLSDGPVRKGTGRRYRARFGRVHVLALS